VEEEIARIYPSDKIKSPVHLSIGQEAISVGICEALRPEDVVFGTYRGHALYLAKGGDLRRMIAELYGKETGCARGKGGSMHLVDVAAGMMGTSAVVGTTIPNAVGYAYAMQTLRKPVVVASFFGDGAVEEGVFHESVTFAVLKRLPVLFVCENNRYAIHTPLSTRQPSDRIAERVAAYGLPTERIERNDTIACFERASAHCAAIREGVSGPVFLECMTYRWREHVGPGVDWNLGYRSESEARPWMDADEIDRLGAWIPAAERESLDATIESEIADAIAFAEVSSFPPVSELCTGIYKER
jgi:TPP-dependent pyruvate/acetoin dehydrogenase alpha subunit